MNKADNPFEVPPRPPPSPPQMPSPRRSSVDVGLCPAEGVVDDDDDGTAKLRPRSSEGLDVGTTPIWAAFCSKAVADMAG